MQLRAIGFVVRQGADIVQRWLRGGRDHVAFNRTLNQAKQLESQKMPEQWDVCLDNVFEESSPICSCGEWKGGYCARSSGVVFDLNERGV